MKITKEQWKNGDEKQCLRLKEYIHTHTHIVRTDFIKETVIVMNK